MSFAVEVGRIYGVGDDDIVGRIDVNVVSGRKIAALCRGDDEDDAFIL